MRDITNETFDAILFDNDGTLADSSAAVERSWASWAQEYDVPLERFGNFHGVPSRGIVQRVAPELDLEAATADIDRRELDDVDGVVALPGSVDALSALGERAAIVTSAGRTLALLRLEAAGIPVPAVLISADDITHGKPDPEPYLLGARRLGADPARCLVVEDATAGLEAGRAAGSATLAVRTTAQDADLGPLADLIVDDLSRVRFDVDERGIRVSLRG